MLLTKEQFNDSSFAVNEQQHIFESITLNKLSKMALHGNSNVTFYYVAVNISKNSNNFYVCVVRPSDTVVRRLRVYLDSTYLLFLLFFVSYPPSSLKGTQPKRGHMLGSECDIGAKPPLFDHFAT